MNTEKKIAARKHYAGAVFQYYHLTQKLSDDDCEAVIALLDKAIDLYPNFQEACDFREEVWHYFLKKRDPNNNRKTYSKYLKSRAWAQKKKEVMRRDDGKCICGKASTEVHHKNYNDVGKESISNLVSLCKNCHNRVKRDYQNQ